MEEAERRWELKPDEVEQRSQGPYEKCVLCLERIQDGEQAVRLPCHHVFHKDCMLPALRDGTITGCPLDSNPVDLATMDRLPVFVCGQLIGATLNAMKWTRNYSDRAHKEVGEGSQR